MCVRYKGGVCVSGIRVVCVCVRYKGGMCV